ncbi:hypothetical protein PoB_001139200 [Plakobranchus ocellatus]|uniref:Uncharacterized protein n=1 Tax=Plakobranchus ocellatus TaxID=259542 RepID=A0AAV3YPI9_9GAST|nr:hypothetical protein PoB_001139200 [Plakobranchus ocellatus]
MLSVACFGHVETRPKCKILPVADGWLNRKKVHVLRGSESSRVVVRKGLVEQNTEINTQQKKVCAYLSDGKTVPDSVSEARLKSSYFTRKVSTLETWPILCMNIF